MKNSKPNASSVKAMLIAILVILSVFIVVGFYFVQNWLSEYAATINTSPTTINTQMSPKELNTLQAELFKNQSTVDKAADITASMKDYNSRIQQDINRYAAHTGIKVTDFGPANTPSMSAMTSLAGGVKASYVSITIQNPVPYSSLIKFIKAIETNLPKMRLTGIGIKRIDSPKGNVNVDPITIEIYLR